MYLWVGEVDFEEFSLWFRRWRSRSSAQERDAEASANHPTGSGETEQLQRPQSAPVVVRTYERTGAVNLDDDRFTDRLRQIFNRYDEDGSGEIDAEELQQIMATLGKEMTIEEVTGMINEIDDSGDALIDFEEFCALIKGGDDASDLAVLLREQTFGAMDAEEKYMWARGRILQLRNGMFAPVFSREMYDKAIAKGATEPFVAEGFT